MKTLLIVKLFHIELTFFFQLNKRIRMIRMVFIQNNLKLFIAILSKVDNHYQLLPPFYKFPFKNFEKFLKFVV